MLRGAGDLDVECLHLSLALGTPSSVLSSVDHELCPHQISTSTNDHVCAVMTQDALIPAKIQWTRLSEPTSGISSLVQLASLDSC